jgi:hypothetical protein
MYYVGTTYDVKRRYRQHCEGTGSAWTRLHPPVLLLCEEQAVSPFHEDGKVKELMARHGIDSVRGGSYCQAELPDEKRAALEEELRHAQGTCLRCGRAGHWATGCCAKTDIAGNPLPNSARQPKVRVPLSAGSAGPAHTRRCSRCGRAGYEADTAGNHLSGSARQPKVRVSVSAGSAGPAHTRWCSRCGRAGHKAAVCRARTDAAGCALLLPARSSPPLGIKPLEGFNGKASRKGGTSVARNACRRCGRVGHRASGCFARTSSAGALLSAERGTPTGGAATAREPPLPDADAPPTCGVM